MSMLSLPKYQTTAAFSLTVLLLLGAATALYPKVQVATRAASNESIVSAVNSETTGQRSDSPRRIYAPHWVTTGGFKSTLYLRNVHVERAVTANVSLLLDHGTITLSPLQIDPLQTAAIDVSQALAENGENAGQSGAAVIEFLAESAGAVSAYAHVIDAGRSLSYSFPFAPPDTAAGPIDAAAWYYSKNADAFIALQNTTNKAIIAWPTVFVSGRATRLPKQQLKANEARVLTLPRQASLQTGAEPQSIGVRLQYSGDPGGLVAQGWLMDGEVGFSLPFTFHSKSNCSCAGDVQHKYGTGIMIGAGGMAHMGGGANAVTFSPFLTARNISTRPLLVTPVFSFNVDGRTEKAVLPALNLGVQQTSVVNLRKYQEAGIFPLSVEMGDLDLQYQGDAGALIAELASVDQDGSFVSPVPLTCNGNRVQHMVFWRTDGDWHSSVTIENISSQDNDLEITISYPGGIYVLEKTIAAAETTMISINDLQQSQVPDPAGRRIPLDAKLGGANIWSRNSDNGLVINAMLVNPVTRTCGPCDAHGWVVSGELVESSATVTAIGFEQHFVGDQFGIKLILRWSDGYRSFFGATFISSAVPSVADYVGGSLVCTDGGTTYIQAVSYQSLPQGYNCDFFPLHANNLLNVMKVTMSAAIACKDGDTPTFSVTVTGGTPTSYQWSFTAPSGAGNNPNVTFNPNNAASTTTNCHWFAKPNQACSPTSPPQSTDPYFNSVYTIKCKVFFGNKNKTVQTTLTVNAYWNPAGVTDPNEARVTGAPAMAADANGVWRVTGMGTLGRQIPMKQVFVPAASQFFTKTDAHEQAHVDHWSPGQLLGTVHQPADFYQRIQNFTGTSQQDLLNKITADFLTYTKLQDAFVQSKHNEDERQAYVVSDPIAPMYAYQNCGAY